MRKKYLKKLFILLLTYHAMRDILYSTIRATAQQHNPKGEIKMTKLQAFEGWLDEATEGFAGTEIDLHGFKTAAEYVEAYFDGVECYISTEEAKRLADLYEDYQQSVLGDGQYSLAYDRMLEAVENE